VGSGEYPTETINITLYTGWNLVGYPSFQPELASVVLPPEVDKISVYDISQPYFIRDVSDLSLVVMLVGKGYWVHVTSDTVWTVMDSQPPDPVEALFSISHDEEYVEDEGIETIVNYDDIGITGISQDRQNQGSPPDSFIPMSQMVIILLFFTVCLLSRWRRKKSN
ncbi:MAG: hypothetical protein KAX31_07245, partial [Thermoplasmata archaeon]|nr:hypothetical protein [Thermoplasmata archaeon]